MKKERRYKPYTDFYGKFSQDYSEFTSGRGENYVLRDAGRFHHRAEGVSVKFDNIEDHLGQLISESEVALGAIAWLTNDTLLKSLSGLKRISVIVQKEDFLRHDLASESRADFSNRIRKRYDALTPLSRNDFLNSYPGLQEGMPGFNPTLQHLLIAADGQYIQTDDAVRCLGYRRDQRSGAVPTMHHKFVVLGTFAPDIVIRPTCVITGSFNWTENAVRSRENVVTIYDERVCDDFVSEWAQLWAISEPLNWTSDTPVFPNHYVGT